MRRWAGADRRPSARAADRVAVPWKNGGGTTRELLAWPAALLPALAWAAEAPTPSKGDTAWMLTATALVLQVLKIIPSDLLAAYSSNLFGITCVALVKIRHVRPPEPYKGKGIKYLEEKLKRKVGKTGAS